MSPCLTNSPVLSTPVAITSRSWQPERRRPLQRVPLEFRSRSYPNLRGEPNLILWLTSHSVPFNFTLARCPPHPHDRRLARPSYQGHSCNTRGSTEWNQRIVQDDNYDAHRVLRHFRCELIVGHRTIGYQTLHLECSLANPR